KAFSIATLVLIPPIDDGTKIGTLLDRGADVNTQDGDGRSLLMRLAASDAAPPAIVKRLIDGGAKVDVVGKNGETALAYARQRGATPIVKMLERGAMVRPEREAFLAPEARSAKGAAERALARSPREAVERSLPLLQANDVSFLKKSGCVSCQQH